ncbi:hypothetical protein DL770_010426 [Monosporascus sp. CRB-9-2]|nr:hypothetical protein DL770_010426 [Monosporascus sp. CRB-9-2]
MEKLCSSKTEWRKEVAENAENFEREVEKSQRRLKERRAKVEQKNDVGSEPSNEQKYLKKRAERLDRHRALIKRLKEWKESAEGVQTQSQSPVTVPETAGPNAVEEDVEPEPQSQSPVTTPETAGPDVMEEDVKPEPLYGLKASVMHFRLAENKNTLTAIARYYQEEPKPIDDRKPYDPNARKTEKLLAPRVAEEMDYEADERLLRDHVKTDPPLHIRRTLDQYYFVTLDDTSQRDKDQVVYRGTKAGDTRVVMVDQLWLWILDDNTIITSFPRRWGRNKPDPSGVHKTLRERLETRKEEIKSIYHLGISSFPFIFPAHSDNPTALIIIDQCSRVFFDRTKPLDQRPEVMDLFASAIGNVTEMTTIAYDSFWRALRTGNVGKKTLDLNPEGVLFREAQDIAEELKIMKRIYTEQLKVVKDFKRHLFDPLCKDKEGEIALLKQLLLEMKNQVSSNGGNPPSEGEEPDVKAKKGKALEATLHEAEGTIELIESRQAEIQDLEDSALRTYQQQQTSIVEANAAVQQGQSIMALTIVSIFFLPLGFFAAFFGMNNAEINGAPWMGLGEQIGYMFGLSSIIIMFSISIAFNPWVRAILGPIRWIPYRILRILHKFIQNPTIRNKLPWNHNLEQKVNNWLQDMKNNRLIGNEDGQEDSPAWWRGTATRRRQRRGPQGDAV